MSVRMVCEECGYVTTSRTEKLAAYGIRRHSCDKQRADRERAQRVADRKNRSGPEAPCRHDGRHPHGDRVRYVIDKCRCRPFGIWGGLSAVERRQLLPRAPGPARLTHCQRAGHDWSIPENVRVRPDGSRYCAECTRIGVNARRKRKREAAA